MTTTIEQAQAELPTLIASLRPGEELVITQQNRPVARLVAEPAATPRTRKLGGAKGKLIVREEDDEHLKDFDEYMP